MIVDDVILKDQTSDKSTKKVDVKPAESADKKEVNTKALKGAKKKG